MICLICLFKTIWRTVKGKQFWFGGFPISGHDFIEQKDGSLMCEMCGFISKWKPMTTTKENWIEQFDKIAPVSLEIKDYICDLSPVIKKIKSFIQTLISDTAKNAREEIIEEMKKCVPEKVKYMWWCYGEILGKDELEISHITDYPCKEHPHSSGSSVEAGFNS